MPEAHDPMGLPRQNVPELPTKKARKPKPVEPKPQSWPNASTKVVCSNIKPHKKVLAPIGRTVPIEPVGGLDEILDQFEDQSHVWVTVKPSADVLVIRLSGTVLGTVALPTNTDPFGSETKVTSATIEKSDGQVKVSVDLPSDDDAGSR